MLTELEAPSVMKLSSLVFEKKTYVRLSSYLRERGGRKVMLSVMSSFGKGHPWWLSWILKVLRGRLGKEKPSGQPMLVLEQDIAVFPTSFGGAQKRYLSDEEEEQWKEEAVYVRRRAGHRPITGALGPRRPCRLLVSTNQSTRRDFDETSVRL
jgi:hypothetical protein